MRSQQRPALTPLKSTDAKNKIYNIRKLTTVLLDDTVASKILAQIFTH